MREEAEPRAPLILHPSPPAPPGLPPRRSCEPNFGVQAALRAAPYFQRGRGAAVTPGGAGCGSEMQKAASPVPPTHITGPPSCAGRSLPVPRSGPATRFPPAAGAAELRPGPLWFLRRGRRRCRAGRQQKCGDVCVGGLPRCPPSSPQRFGDADAKHARVTASRPRWQRAARWCFAPNKGPWPWLYPKTQPRRFPAGTCPGKLLSDVCLSPSPSPKPSPHRAGAFWAVVAVSPPGSPGAPQFGGCWRARLRSWLGPNTLRGAAALPPSCDLQKGTPAGPVGTGGQGLAQNPNNLQAEG